MQDINVSACVVPSRETDSGRVNAPTKAMQKILPVWLEGCYGTGKLAGSGWMRNGATHFEQVPMEVVKSVLREAARLARKQEESPALVSGLEDPAVAKPTMESEARI